ncbi:MAG TPA: sodium-dependent bicarbonate transport family permease [Mesorhizobium sp.]|jgi:hypothetical protein|nr:sodium-dependent bicarbonate transport family permease [Mesorhizobium sp.]
MLDLVAGSLLSPAILCFLLGGFAALLRSDLKLPEPVFAALALYLMLSIGLKGGGELAERSFEEIAAPVAAALVLGCAIPLWCYAILRRFMGLPVADAAALAAHYGSVSAVTFAAVTSLLSQQGVPFEGYAAALLAIMEVPGIVVALGLAGLSAAASRAVGVSASGAAVLGGSAPAWRDSSGLSAVLSQVLSSKSIVLLAGGLAIGAIAGKDGIAPVKPFFVDLFAGVLCLFLLDLGRVAASHLGDFRQVGLRLAGFAIAMPVLHAALGIAAAWAAGMSEGGAVVLATLAASASYIAAPAAVRMALPEANPGYYLTCSLAITFPFNIVVGIPLYQAMAANVYG